MLTSWIIFGGVALAGVLGRPRPCLSVRRRRRGGLDPPETVRGRGVAGVGSISRQAWPRVPTRVGRISTTHRHFTKRFSDHARVGWKPSEADRLGFEQLVSDIESLALLECEARYGPRQVGEVTASEAWAAAQRIRRSLRYHHLGRTARGLVLTSRNPGQRQRGTNQGAYASSGHGGNHGEGLGGADRAGE